MEQGIIDLDEETLEPKYAVTIGDDIQSAMANETLSEQEAPPRVLTLWRRSMG